MAGQISGDQTAIDVAVGDEMPDGTIYAGISPDTGKAMYTTRVDAPGTYTFDKANQYAKNLTASGHHDFRLPTKSELNLLFQNRLRIGGFKSRPHYAGWYWSSSQDIDDTVWGQHFSNGLQISYGKLLDSSLRCVR